MKKILTIGILFIIGSIIGNPLVIGQLLIDDITPPITTCTLDPSQPNGDNGWYVTNVTVILNASDEKSGVQYISYRISDGQWKNQSGDIVIFVLTQDCLIEGSIEYFAVDNAGNQEEIQSVDGICIDQLPPECNFTYETYKEGGMWNVDFIINCVDNCSGCDCRIEFWINDGLHEIIEGSGPNYVFTLQWSKSFRNHCFYFYCYDKAGNGDIIFIHGSDIKCNLNFQHYHFNILR
jgi:hypothetical protein